MKRIIVLILTFAIAVMIAGCGGNNNAPQASPASSESATPSAPAPESPAEPVELSFLAS